MDCHALMFAKAGELMKEKGYDFLFSGEVVGQRPKSQNKNSLRYVEKNSGFDGWILRPLSAKCLPETEVETKGLVDRDQLMDINGRSRKIQMEMAKDFGVKEYPSPAGGCLLTDKTFSERLKDLMYHQKIFDISELHLLKHGRHFRLDDQTKVITGRSKHDNRYLMKAVDLQKHAWIHHAHLPGPDVVMTGDFSPENLKIAAQICAAYTRSPEGQPAEIQVSIKEKRFILQTDVRPAAEFKELML